MSSQSQAEGDEVEEDVEFISEGPIRPVLECIDLLTDSDGEGPSSFAFEDEVTRQRQHVTSTLDRLAHQVALKKKERADKCRAFKEKQILQKAHGQQELAFSSPNGLNQEAKRCVDMWLKMPGPQPGMLGAGSGRRHRPSSFPANSSTRQTCPVINCGRVYDNASLLDGHLKRFDHSPCDPSINLKGSPSEFFACVACGQYFQTKEAWRKHLETKISSSDAGDHSFTQTYQRIVCFACPACYILFNLRDECLQHMSASNHFTDSLPMTESRERALPVPVPQYVKNRLIALCKDAIFNVRCSLCHNVLASHQAAQAHFNVYCRQGCAVAKAEKTIVQVMKQLQVQGQCSHCCKIFLSQAELEKHKESNQHEVEINHTMGKALLQHCRFSEIQHTQRPKETQEKRQSISLGVAFQKRNKKRTNSEAFPSKRHRMSLSGSSNTSGNFATAWFCECGLQFSEEAAASNHLLAVNQIFHQCGVCGKLMGESSITRLHMSRFHGGAHLSNFLFFCRKCKVEMPRYEDILLHVSEVHSGHTYFTQQDVPVELASVTSAKPSTSKEVALHSSLRSTVQQSTGAQPSLKAEQTWMCRMCEDVFDSEEAVQKHCSDLSSHSFQRYICGHCPQKFFKESTVRRHCMNEHNGEIKSSHFCGLCDSMQFETEGEFLAHYNSLHSKDYYCIEEDDDVEVVQPVVAASASQLTCPCMGSERSTGDMKAINTQCMRNLATEDKCQYVCASCSVSLPSYAQIKTHVHTKHAAMNLDKTFDVLCKVCQESFMGVPSFHKHYHSHHCSLEPCVSSRTCRKDTKAESIPVKMLNAVEIRPDTQDIEDETLVKFLNMGSSHKEVEEHNSDEEMKEALSLSSEEARESAELEEALKRSLLEF
ncbi:E3 SUMO-protein ligase ZNF451 [Betta splendens]|uniref:E3 SUMO-protein ligase ZNF451 n=1 Tax=Betta splendens TaxID=158456 RepID=A0A6P7PZU7_BETSP|nr:E3 SUMO-protein ligase ZNF451 [Betta splendens]XP_040929896.1 E3 SUMO-protein ligase ZNF451 [Betta splendens]